MDYTKTYFNKSIDDLEYSDIESFFSEEKEESNTIEFKSYSSIHGNFNKNIEGVIRGICAFLNSDGGVIIWGAPEGTVIDGRTEKVFVGTLSPVDEMKEKDWLINKVSDSITPLPVGIKVNTLEKDGAYVYVLEVQQSTYSPHQFKNIYYARLDGQTKPAPHYLIDALFKKITYPQIEGYIKLDSISSEGGDMFLDITIFIFNFSQLQNEEKVSFRLMCAEGIFTKSQLPQFADMYMYDGHQLVHKDLIDVLHFGAPNIHQERIMFNIAQLNSDYEGKVRLFLSFGGRFSPFKVSDYTLDLSKRDWSKPDEPNYLMIEMKENVLSSDYQKEVGSTRETTLKKILNR